ncbi:hypothetical protein Nwat_1290 [Nitrosococcus watsonii C-113]|uniref:Uncharacterized protein n=1 Tax=Nitrosococcus watsoni (strain C-113) TaxID=105559 RepID=D8K5N9_NITWC|nr:hypothetical protein Nwat_1290 [Nitrosococcus watsonii C-113]
MVENGMGRIRMLRCAQARKIVRINGSCDPENTVPVISIPCLEYHACDMMPPYGIPPCLGEDK